MKPRVASIDLIRGAGMILMAIDHVRVFSGLPAGGPTPGIFFTRWITHFCAPAFIFLAGTSCFLSSTAVGRYDGTYRPTIVPPYHRTIYAVTVSLDVSPRRLSSTS